MQRLIDYNNLALEYDCKYKNDMCKRENLAVIDLLNKYISEGKKILDLGCGTGFCRECIKSKVDYHGYDTSEKMLLIARNKLPFVNLYLGTINDVVDTDFDVVTSLFSLPYIDNGNLSRIFNLLKSRGIFIAVYYNKPYLNPDSVYYKRKIHYKLFVQPKVKKSIRQLKEMGFVLQEDFLTDDRTYKYIIIES